MIELITPDWSAPSNVQAASTTRHGGVSQGFYKSLNLGLHTGDDLDHVMTNRQRLATALQWPQEPVWLRQVHGNQVIDAGQVADSSGPIEADAACAFQSGLVCVVMTADCLPILLCDRAGSRIAAVHAGWRGLERGVIAACLESLHCSPEELLAWLGPAIGPDTFEVGSEVREAFLQLDKENKNYFKSSSAGRWLADIYALARHQLQQLGVANIYGGGWCTVSEKERFFSYRRERTTGRMASLIWLDG